MYPFATALDFNMVKTLLPNALTASSKLLAMGFGGFS